MKSNILSLAIALSSIIFITGCASSPGNYVVNGIGFPVYCRDGYSDCETPNPEFQVDVIRDIVIKNCGANVLPN